MSCFAAARLEKPLSTAGCAGGGYSATSNLGNVPNVDLCRCGNAKGNSTSQGMSHLHLGVLMQNRDVNVRGVQEGIRLCADDLNYS